MISIRTVGIALCVVLSHTVLALASVIPVTVTHSYLLGDDDSRNSARQKCLAEAKRKILEQVGVYLESRSAILTSARSATSGNAKSPQTTSEERQQINEQITTLTAGLIRTEVAKEEFREVNGRLEITLTVKAEIDPDDIQKQLAASRADQGIRKQVIEQSEKLRQLEEQLSIVIMQSKVGVQRPPSARYEQNSRVRLKPSSQEQVAEARLYADQGDSVGQLFLGVAYLMGDGVPQDDTEALKWLKLAADQADARAQFLLGLSYYNGRGVPQNTVTAANWYRLAADQGYAVAQRHLGMLYSVEGDDVAAIKSLRLAADQGDAEAQLSLGLMYSAGKGVPEDNVAAGKWFRLAAEQGHAEAQLFVALMYAEGIGVPQDAVEAVRWYRRSAAQGDTEAQFNLGNMYRTGQGVVQDTVKAHMWFNLAARKGDEKFSKVRSHLARRLTAEQLAQAETMARECVMRNYKDCE